MKRSKWTMLTASAALIWIGTNGATAFAQTSDIARKAQAARVEQIAQSGAQPKTPPTPSTATSPMAKPPDSASGATSSTNPDNMPIKRPDKPTHDNMSRQPPASGANAK